MIRSRFALRTLAALGAAVVLTIGGAKAQTDTSYYVGAIPKAGIAALGSGLPVTTIAASGAAVAVTPGTYGSASYDITLTANSVQLSVSGFTAGIRQTVYLLLRQDATAGRSFVLPTGAKWSNNATLTQSTTANTITELSLTSTDGGVTVIAK